MVVIDNKAYRVNADEYVRILHPEYTNLKLYKDLALHERLVGLIRHCATNLGSGGDPSTVFSFHTTHGGFIPLQVSAFVDKVYVTETHETHLANIQENIHTFAPKNIHVGYPNRNSGNIRLDILYIDHLPEERSLDDYRMITGSENWIVITDKHVPREDSVILQLSNTDRWVYVDRCIWVAFQHAFRYYLPQETENNNATPAILCYDNLLHLCIMVKNAGPQFEQMLQDNLPLLDQWTILDTGSTDDTVNIINKVLVGKKEGRLYQEPFVNFRDSRNRLLDLASTYHSKYMMMLDDTYVVQGDLRKFLTEVRSDQYATSFTLFIHSDDSKYGSNRIIKGNSDLRYVYRIHEVISDKNNINVVIPEPCAHIEDRRFDYMEKRTLDRKRLDLVLLNEELEEDINNPRTYYYLAQTYNCLGEYDKAFAYFMKRCEFTNAGFLQERVDAAFEAARLANFKLNQPWEVCERLYEAAFKIDETRPESLYFIGIHYYLENQYEKAYGYFKRAFDIGFPVHCQYSLKPTLSFHFLPKFLARVCYSLEHYEVGQQACELFLTHNPSTADDFAEMASWLAIYQKLNLYRGPKIPQVSEKPIFCFVADGGFAPWSGPNILTTGVGGSETYIIEMARYIQRNSPFEVYVFCNTPQGRAENFEGVHYRHLDSYYQFINTHYVKHVIVSRYSEYLPVTFKGFSENVYFVVHDLTPSGVVIPMDQKLKQVFCLTEWHVSYLTNIFKDLAPITVPFYYGIDETFKEVDRSKKVKHQFIYSSFPNRGLLQLLQMWPTIYQTYPTATLHIYADVDNQWSNQVEPEKMNAIKQLLQTYQAREQGLGIHYHGWVSKAQLAEAWKTADIWFYPCTFQETFCLTALEAASSQTLCVTNDLAALQNTVGQRGVVIEGDATTEEWQTRALYYLFHIMDEANAAEKNMFVDINYAWSKTLSWESQAQRLLQEYIAPNDVFEYKGMYNWTNDLPTGSKQIFLDVLDYFKKTYPKAKAGQPLSVLEIGTYAGISLIHLLQHLPNATGVGVDLWQNYDENSLLQVVDQYRVQESFNRNILRAGLGERVMSFHNDSTTALVIFVRDRRTFDFIYVDGSHLLLDCYTDLVLSWQVLKIGGILAIDDYLYKHDDPNILNSPFEAVNHFMKVMKGKYKVLHMGYRVFLEKLL